MPKRSETQTAEEPYSDIGFYRYSVSKKLFVAVYAITRMSETLDERNASFRFGGFAKTSQAFSPRVFNAMSEAAS